jgi:methionine transaminase
MTFFPDSIISKLPHTGTSVFAVMTQMAREYNAINLSQGFPDFMISEKLIRLVGKYMRKGFNQYAPMPGLLELRERIAEKTQSIYGAIYDPVKEITVTAGATQALFTAISAFVRDEDEVIILEPAYDSYAPAVKLNGGMPIAFKLKPPEFSIDWNEVKRLVSSRTRMIILNSPHNPTGSILKEHDLVELDKMTRDSGILILSDEVYEHIIFDGQKHQSVCMNPSLRERSLVVSSFGKTFHATGWKTGYCVAPEVLMKEFRKVHQFMVFAVNTPIQFALSEYLKDPLTYGGLGEFYQQKRDFFLNAVGSSRFKYVPAAGTYFQILDYSSISDEEEMVFAQRLVKEHKLAAVPTSSFYVKPVNNKMLRLCFAKSEQTLDEAANILCKI